MNRIALITSIKPNPYNNDGRPSGLIWECLEVLHRYGIYVDLIEYKNSKSRIIQRLKLYGIGYYRKFKQADDYDAFIVYPENLLFYLPRNVRSKAIVIGPDSPSLRDGRMFRRAEGIVYKGIRRIMYLLSLWHEYRLVRDSKSVYVVGRTDALWMRIYNQKIFLNKSIAKKIKFLRHPCLSKVIKDSLSCDELNKNRRFVFSGQISEKSEKKFVHDLFYYSSLFARRPLSLIVLGNSNRWIAREAEKYHNIHVEFKQWIENYNDVCKIFSDIHCLPINTGAGTKNRTLTAIANGLYIVTTPMGIENIMYHGLQGIFVASTAKRFAKRMCLLNEDEMCTIDKRKFIKDRYEFRSKVFMDFCKGIELLVADIKNV